VTTYERTFTGTLTGGGSGGTITLTVLDASVTLDEGWAPYAQASVVIKHPGAAALARLSNLAARPRVQLRITSTPGGTRSFDLGLTARQVFVETGTVGLSLASDEAVMQDFAHTGLTPDLGMRPLQTSTRQIVQYVMSRALGVTTIVETNDFDFTTFYRSTNLWPFIPTTDNQRFVAGVNALVQGDSSLNSWQVIPRGTASNDTYAVVGVSMTAGKTYTLSARVGMTIAQNGGLHAYARRAAVIVTESGVERLLALTPAIPNAQGATYQRITFTVPVNVSATTVRLYSGGAQPTSGGSVNAVSFKDVFIIEGDGKAPDGTLEQYFDGDTGASTAYTYAWDGAPGTSSSTRTPRLSRSPEILIWKPGQTAWDFLSPILESAGLRFWCDELRRWHLTTPTYSLPGTVQAHAGSNLYAATDLMSRTASQSDGVPLYLDAVIIRYTWIDDLGNDRERYDVATTEGFTKPFLIERPETPFPGAGAATYLLRRYMLRRRQVPVTAAIDLAATPGMGVSIRVGDGTLLTGYLDAVTFDMGADEMPLKTKSLIETLPTAWSTLASGIPWSASPIGASWASETA
jgi:hypothetical protein